jgi:hypothetical protein
VSPDIPQYLLTAVALDDVQVLLKYWDEVMHPIPDEEWGPSHPLFELCCFVAYAIEDIGEKLMTADQLVSSRQRESFHNPALPRARG